MRSFEIENKLSRGMSWQRKSHLQIEKKEIISQFIKTIFLLKHSFSLQGVNIKSKVKSSQRSPGT